MKSATRLNQIILRILHELDRNFSAKISLSPTAMNRPGRKLFISGRIIHFD